MWTSESLMAAIAAQLPESEAATLQPAAAALADFLNAAPAAGAEVPAAAKPTVQGLIDMSNTQIGGGVKIGDVVIGPQLKIVTSSEAIRPLDLTPQFEKEAFLQEILRHIDPQVLDSAVRNHLGLTNEPLVAGPYAWKVARALLRADRVAVGAIATRLAASDCARAKEIVDFVWPFSWIDREAAAKLAANAPRPVPERGVALNTTELDTGRDYIKCAPMRPNQYWRVSVVAAPGEEATDTLIERIRARIAEETGRSVKEAFDRMERRSLFLFIVLDWAIDQPQLVALRDALPLATFVTLVGEVDQAAFDRRGLTGVQYLTPAIGPGVEAEVREARGDVEEDIDRTWKNLKGAA